MNIDQIIDRNYPTARAEQSVKEALDLMRERGVHGLPVVDADGTFRGYLSNLQFIQFALPKYLDSLGGSGFLRGYTRFYEQLRLVRDQKVGDVMVTEVTSLTPETTVEEAAYLMVSKRFAFVPVVVDGKFAGAVTRYSILRLIDEPATP